MTDKQAIKRYLGRYYQTKKRHKQLVQRLEEKEREVYGISAVRYDDMPKAQRSRPDTISSRKIEECEVERERVNSHSVLLNKIEKEVYNVIEWLPEDIDERIVVEYRDIDCLSWNDICDRESIARATAIRKYNRGIELLLMVDEVNDLVKEYKKHIS